MDLKPDESRSFQKGEGQVLLIACGALAREIIALIELNDWHHLDVTCLPAKLHNEPKKIPEAVREKIHANRDAYKKIFVLYADCGTGGLLDKVLAEEGVERIGGPHCYSFFSGNQAFSVTSETEITSFYLTDYLAKHFETLIWKGLGMDRHPELKSIYFAHYEKVVYLAQTENETLAGLARQAAEKLGLEYEYRFTGYGDLESYMAGALQASQPS